MSREIKFRAWDKLTRIIVPYEEMSCHESKFEYGRRALLSGFLQNPDYEVMQFTGLKDKNGVEIYEGDIVNGVFETSDDWQTYKSPYKKLRVTYNNEYACFTTCSTISNEPKHPFENYLNFLYQLTEIEVIGNIFQNPELLEDSK